MPDGAAGEPDGDRFAARLHTAMAPRCSRSRLSTRVQMAAAPLGTGEAGSELSYDEFKQAVLEQQIRNARANGRQHYPPVPTSELDAVEAGHRMRTEAARNCRALLAAARLALDQAKAAQDPKAIRSSAIGIGSSYRDYDYDKGLWDRYYPDYYRATQADRDAAAAASSRRRRSCSCQTSAGSTFSTAFRLPIASRRGTIARSA